MTTFNIIFTVDTDHETSRELFAYLWGHCEAWPLLDNAKGTLELEIGEHEWAVMLENIRDS